MTREQLFRSFFFGVFLLLLWQLGRVLSPFLPAVLWASTFTLVFYPLYPPLRRRLHPDLAALAATALVVVGVLAPLGATAYLVARHSAALLPAARQWLAQVPSSEPQRLLPGPLRAGWEQADAALAPTGLSLQDLLIGNIKDLTGAIAQAAAEAAKGAVTLALGLLVLAVSLFFGFRRGEDLLAWLTELIPMTGPHKAAVTQALRETFTVIVRGVLAGAALQGLFAGLGFALSGQPFPVLLGLACAFASLIPYAGAALVWLPVCARLLWLGRPSWLFLLAWSLAFDVLGRRLKQRLAGAPTPTQLSGLLLFFSILGGLRVYGPNGVLLGPLLTAVALAFARIYRREFSRGGEPR